MDGNVLVADIRKALSSESTYHFTELLNSCNVLASTEHEPYLQLLGIFSTGKYTAYSENAANLPELSEQELTKLRILTILRMSISRRVLSYSDIMAETGLSNNRDLEQVIIQSIQHGVLDCKIDEASAQVFVNQVSGYDVTEDQYDTLLNSLMSWSQSCGNVLKNVEADVESSTIKLTENELEVTEFQNSVEAAKAAVKKEKPQREATSTKSRKRLA